MQKKVIKIEFEIDQTQGEMPFRNYISSAPVGGFIFTVLSKITGDNNVFFKLYTLNTKNGDVDLTMEKTLAMDKFQQAMTILEGDLKKKDPNVKLQVQPLTEGGFAISDKGPIPEHIAKGLLAEEMIGDLIDSSGESRADFVLGAIKSGVFPPGHVFALMSAIPPEQRFDFLKKVSAEVPDFLPDDIKSHVDSATSMDQLMHAVLNDSNIHAKVSAVSEALGGLGDILKGGPGQSSPSNRLKNFL